VGVEPRAKTWQQGLLAPNNNSFVEGMKFIEEDIATVL